MTDSKPVLDIHHAVNLGEYHPDFLSKYPEWKKMSAHMQFEFIRKAIDNRRAHLRREYASICNQLNFSTKPHLEVAMQKIVAAQKALNDEEEALQMEYAGK